MKKVFYHSFLLLLINFSLNSFPSFGQDALKINENYYIINGNSIYCKTVGSGKPIVILHGGPGLDHTSLLPQFYELAKNYKLIFYDQRGSGKSTGKIDSVSISIDNFVEDLEGLRQQLHFEKMNLLGHSWGGLLAMNYAIKYPKRIKKLMLVSSFGATSKFIPEFVKNREERRTKEDSTSLANIMESTGFAKRAPPVMEQFMGLFFKSYFYDQSKYNQLTITFNHKTASNLLPIFTLLSKEFSNYDITNKIKKIDFPVLIIHGQNDPVPVKYAYGLNRIIKKSQLVVIKNCGHFPFVEAKEKFISSCANFLK